MKRAGRELTTKMIDDPRNSLWNEVHRFITENGVNCPEAIYQNDRVILNAQEFLERICSIVGYANIEEEP